MYFASISKRNIQLNVFSNKKDVEYKKLPVTAIVFVKNALKKAGIFFFFNLNLKIKYCIKINLKTK